MKSKAALLLAGLLPLTLLAQTNAVHPPVPGGIVPSPALSTEMPEKGKLSYVLGAYFANNITNQLKHGGDLTLDYDVMMSAISDVLKSKPQKYSEKESTEIMTQLRGALQAKRAHDQQELQAKSDKFLDQFKTTPGVITTADGIEYKILKDGTGPSPKSNDSSLIAYRGTLVDGTVFDQNDNFPASPGRGLIQGWQKVLPMMKVGSKWQVVIPPRMGYGPRAMGKIPANSILIFDMEMKGITPAPTNMPPQLPTSVTPNSPNAVSGEIIKVPSAEELKHGAKIEVIKAGQTNAITNQ